MPSTQIVRVITVIPSLLVCGDGIKYVDFFVIFMLNAT